jgi:hypothetical protein
MNHDQNALEQQHSDVAPRRKNAYKTPTLVMFGQVAALTQSASACNDNDSAGCSIPPSNMGPML